MKRAYYTSCPRCGSHSFEVLNSYAHCAGCLYFEDYYKDTESCFASARALELARAKTDADDEVEDDDELEDQAA